MESYEDKLNTVRQIISSDKYKNMSPIDKEKTEDVLIQNGILIRDIKRLRTEERIRSDKTKRQIPQTSQIPQMLQNIYGQSINLDDSNFLSINQPSTELQLESMTRQINTRIPLAVSEEVLLKLVEERRKQTELDNKEYLNLNIPILNQAEVLRRIENKIFIPLDIVQANLQYLSAFNNSFMTNPDYVENDIRNSLTKVKVLLLCVSADETDAKPFSIKIIKYFRPDLINDQIEFFVVNPEPYIQERTGKFSNRMIWIDREHYIGIPFGDPKYDDSELINNGPYDYIIYKNCSIYGQTFDIIGLNGRDLTKELEQLHRITTRNSVIIVSPFRSGKSNIGKDIEERLPINIVRLFKSLGFGMIGKSDDIPRHIAIFMRP
jgi:hypothetical protein